MKTDRKRIFAFIAILLMCSGALVMSQDDCKVLVKNLEGSYAGDCKKGLAHGEGHAKGTDSYDGDFSKGLPHGDGKYTWADGSIYEGEWRKGLRHGEGSYTYNYEGRDSVQAGIWKNDSYMGEIVLPAYKITRSTGVARSSISKSSDTGSGVRVNLLMAGRANTDIEGFSMVCGSGSQFISGNTYGLQDAAVPYTVSIRYRTWNQMHSTQRDVVFEFTINEPGTFDVTISN